MCWGNFNFTLFHLSNNTISFHPALRYIAERDEGRLILCVTKTIAESGNWTILGEFCYIRSEFVHQSMSVRQCVDWKGCYFEWN